MVTSMRQSQRIRSNVTASTVEVPVVSTVKVASDPVSNSPISSSSLLAIATSPSRRTSTVSAMPSAVIMTSSPAVRDSCLGLASRLAFHRPRLVHRNTTPRCNTVPFSPRTRNGSADSCDWVTAISPSVSWALVTIHPPSMTNPLPDESPSGADTKTKDDSICS